MSLQRPWAGIVAVVASVCVGGLLGGAAGDWGARTGRGAGGDPVDVEMEGPPSGAGPRGPLLDFEDVIIDPVASGDCKMAGDIDGDGFVDAVLGGGTDVDLAWYRWPGWQRTVVGQAQHQFTTDGALADVDSDGDLDIVIPDGDVGDNLFWFRNPLPSGNPADGAQWARLTIGAVGLVCKDVETGDFDGDGLMDVAFRSFPEMGVFFQRTGMSWQRMIVQSSIDGEGMAAGDVDGDGDLDLVIARLWVENPEPAQDARTTPWTSWTYAEGVEWNVKVLVTRLIGTPGMQILTSESESTGPVRWYTPQSGDPRGAWTGRTIIASIERCHTLQAGDVDGDGDLDLALAQVHETSAKQILIAINGGSALAWTPVVIGATGLHNGVLADFGADGDLDLFGANYIGNPPARLFENQGGGCVVDINGDGMVNSSDISAFLTVWLAALTQGGPGGDFDGSGMVNSSDISAFLTAWLVAVVEGC